VPARLSSSIHLKVLPRLQGSEASSKLKAQVKESLKLTTKGLQNAGRDFARSE
jgi:hypothetical protein